jgi:N-acyl-D-amino-acid deacylase
MKAEDSTMDFLKVEYDYVIKNGTVIDPKTELRTIANVGIIKDKVAVITRADLKSKHEMDATGKIVCPGFIDPHSHADGQLFSAHVMANMGVTSIIIGSCGVGPFPTSEFLSNLYATTGYPINCGALTPESWILREKAGMTSPYDVATKKQVQMIADWVEQDLLDGAMGVSLGLEYAPKTAWDEMVAISKVAAKYDKVVPIHSRAGGWNGLAATREIIKLQEVTGARVLISHHVYQCGQGMLAESLATIEKAYRQGYKIAVDSGAYCDFACPIGSEVFCEGWQEIYDCDYNDILAGTGPYAGRRLTEKMFDEIKRSDPDTSVTAFVGKPYEVTLALQQPYTMISTDGGFPNLEPGVGHPQSAGTYPKILSRVSERTGCTFYDGIY